MSVRMLITCREERATLGDLAQDNEITARGSKKSRSRVLEMEIGEMALAWLVFAIDSRWRVMP